MALHDEIRREQKKLKGQGPKAYLSYFWTYYKIPTLVVILCIAAAISVIRTLVNHKQTKLGVMYMNAGYPSEEYSRQLQTDLEEILGLDTSKEEVMLMPNEYLTPGGLYSTLDTSSMTKIMAMVSAGQMDVAIMDVYNFQHYVNVGMATGLHEYLTEEEIEALSDQIYWVDGAVLAEYKEKMSNADYEEPTTDEASAFALEQEGTYVRPDPSTMEDPIPAGIFMTGNEHLKDGETQLFDGAECVFGFFGKEENKENAVKCLEFYLN